MSGLKTKQPNKKNKNQPEQTCSYKKDNEATEMACFAWGENYLCEMWNSSLSLLPQQQSPYF